MVKLVDFGLAKYLDASAVSWTGEVVGTKLYMAPEQIQNTSLDGRTDIYGFGATLYHMVTGAPPFHEDPVYEHLFADPCDPRMLNKEVGERLSRVILKCLAKKPAERYPDCRHLEADLREALREAIETEADVELVLLSQTGH